jgi:hypothetical protein
MQLPQYIPAAPAVRKTAFMTYPLVSSFPLKMLVVTIPGRSYTPKSVSISVYAD